MTYRTPHQGYTLIELIVALGVFAIIMTLAAGAYFVVLGIDREARSTSTAVDNLSFALESMTRSIRTGSAYGCTGGGTTCDAVAGSQFSFIDASGNATTYGLTSSGEISKNGNPITGASASVAITKLTFTISGTASGDAVQPRVAISINGNITPNPGQSPIPFVIQTIATERGIDL